MLVRVLLQTSLVLWLAQQTLQGGVKPQSVSWGRALPARGVGVKPGVTGALGSRYGTRAATGTGRYPGAQLGVGGYRALGVGGRAAGYGAQGPYGAGLGAGLADGRTLGLGQGGKRGYGAGLGALPGYGAVAGIGYPGARPGYGGGAGNYLGTGGYGAGLGQGAYLGGAAGKFGGAAPLGQGAYPQGVAGMSAGYGEGVTGYLGAMGGNGFSEDTGAKALTTGYGNGYRDGYGAGLGYPAELADGAEKKAGKHKALSTGAYPGQVPGAYGALGAGLDSTGGRYGGGAAQIPYGNAPMIPAGLEGDGGYPYAHQQLALSAESAKTTSKYGAGAGYGTQRTGYGAQLGATQDALGEQPGKYGGVDEALGNGYKG